MRQGRGCTWPAVEGAQRHASARRRIKDSCSSHGSISARIIRARTHGTGWKPLPRAFNSPPPIFLSSHEAKGMFIQTKKVPVSVSRVHSIVMDEYTRLGAIGEQISCLPVAALTRNAPQNSPSPLRGRQLVPRGRWSSPPESLQVRTRLCALVPLLARRTRLAIQTGTDRRRGREREGNVGCECCWSRRMASPASVAPQGFHERTGKHMSIDLVDVPTKTWSNTAKPTAEEVGAQCGGLCISRSRLLDREDE